MHGPVRVAEAGGTGSAKVVMAFEAWNAGHVATSEWQLSVVAPPPGLKREAVSSRLRQALIHPIKSGVLVDLGYSADGRRIFAGNDRSGIVQFWDAASGRQLNCIETGPRPAIGNVSLSKLFDLSPDGRFLYVTRGSVRTSSIQGKEKRVVHLDVSGDVRVWDVETGKRSHSLQSAPGRGILTAQLSPDGSKLLIGEGLSGDSEAGALKALYSLWDSRTGQRYAAVPKNVMPSNSFSLDSKTLLAKVTNNKGETTDLVILDAASGKVQRSLPFEEKDRKTYGGTFTPDGRRVVWIVLQTRTGESSLKCWDVDSGREETLFQGEKKDRPANTVFSPDGNILAFTNLPEKNKKLYVIDVAKGEVIRIVPLAEEGWPVRRPTFSPDGKWIAIFSQTNPTSKPISQATPDDLPQPRILLIEAATGRVRETIVAPPGIAVSLCFSPDCKTLASGGDGRVLLWDLTKLPGTQSPEH